MRGCWQSARLRLRQSKKSKTCDTSHHSLGLASLLSAKHPFPAIVGHIEVTQRNESNQWIAWRLRVLHTHENAPFRETVWKSFFPTNLTHCQTRSCGRFTGRSLRIVRRRLGIERPYDPIEP